MRSRTRRAGAVLVVLIAGLSRPAPSDAGQEQLIERTVAVVGGAVITLSDVKAAVALGLVEGTWPQGFETATGRLIERWLMLHEVARFAPPEPRQSDVEARVAAVRAHVGSESALEGVLAAGAFTPQRLAQWVRDDLRIAAYLDTRFAGAGAVSDAEVAAYLRARSNDPNAQEVGAADVTASARERLRAERRGALVAEWIVELRRRTEVVQYPRP